jgi:hypothetical protein
MSGGGPMAAGTDPRTALASGLAAIRAGLRDLQVFLSAVSAADAVGELDTAERLARAATLASPTAWVAWHTLGAVLVRRQRIDPAAAAVERALALLGDGPAPLQAASLASDLATLMKDAGRLDEAVAFYRRAVALAPDVAWIRSNLLLCLSYHPGIPPEDVFEAHLEYGRRFSGPFDPVDFPNDPDPERRLRIGYVSPDFRDHAVAAMIEDLLRHHDPDDVEVFCYAEVARPDAVTERLHGLVRRWRPTVGVPDADVARTIRADGIDVLVDLAGHTGGNRLPVFGLKPAPVQMTWIGYPNTTGMPAIDYIGNAVPSGRSVEQPVVMPAMTYRPPADVSDPAPPPITAHGRPTFGCFNNVAKLNTEVIGTWSRILAALPEARLLLKAIGLADPGARADIVARFAAAGVDPARIELRGPSRRTAFMAEMADIDVALDPFPYGGSTTTLDCLWMGVPVVTLDPGWDARMSSRWHLGLLDLPDLVRPTPDAYVETAVALVRDVARLAGLRVDLRARMRASPLCDGHRYARETEERLRRLWRSWASRRAVCPGTVGGGS